MGKRNTHIGRIQATSKKRRRRVRAWYNGVVNEATRVATTAIVLGVASGAMASVLKPTGDVEHE